LFRDVLANDGFRELPSLYVASTRFCEILILDNRSRMGFLDSAHRRRVSRRKTRWDWVLRPSSLVFSPLLSEPQDALPGAPRGRRPATRGRTTGRAPLRRATRASRGRCTSAGRPELERPAAPRGLAGGVAPGAARYTVGAPPRRPAYGIAGRGSGHHGTPRRHGAPLGRHANGQGRACARLPPHRRAAVCRLQPGRPPRGCRPRKRRDCNRPRGAVTGSRLWAATVFSRTYGELRAPFSD
jgi:hypothetical protein